MPLKRPLPFERFPADPIEKVCVYLRADRFHKIAGETIARGGIKVQESEPRIKAH